MLTASRIAHPDTAPRKPRAPVAVPAARAGLAGTTLASVMVDALLAGDTEAATNVALLILTRKVAPRC